MTITVSMLLASFGLPRRYSTSECACAPYTRATVSRDFGSACGVAAALVPNAACETAAGVDTVYQDQLAKGDQVRVLMVLQAGVWLVLACVEEHVEDTAPGYAEPGLCFL